jgi:hypothetical protein
MTRPIKDLIAQRYRLFGVNEAGGHSPLYKMLSAHVADSDAILNFLATLPADRQQPDLFFAAVRLVAEHPVHSDELKDVVISQASRIAAAMRSRTNADQRSGAMCRASSRFGWVWGLISTRSASPPRRIWSGWRLWSGRSRKDG